jgi:NAD-dependent dihydropyrimidine dehydrogenase PreA subunit
MERVKEFFWEVFYIFFRHYNFPSKLGLIKVGNPNQYSPVFLSGNYALTVRRVLRKLKSIDCYLLVANSRGCNVWCAVGMNEFSEFDIIDAINVSNLRNIVKHRKLITPVYAAPGIDTQAVKRETGFNVFWGPTHLNDLPRYVENGYRRTEEMFQVQFGFRDRLEQALSNAMAYAMTISIGLIFWPAFFAKLIALIFVVYLFSFCLYPLFPEERLWRRFILQAAILIGAQSLLGWLLGWTAFQLVLWGALMLATTLLMALDNCGGTPLHKTSLKHWLTKGDYRSLFSPVIDPDLCINCMQCVLVCPTYVFAANRQDHKKVVAVDPDRCEECLACVKQCPTDAIFNRSGEYKGDVKSIPNLAQLVTRDWSHLRNEDRWINAPTQIRNGIPVVITNGRNGSGLVAETSEAYAAPAMELLQSAKAHGTHVTTVTK